MQDFPQIATQRLKSLAPGAHPDADLLTAFAERTLNEQERQLVLTHLAACLECREVVALSLPAMEESQPGVVLGQSAWWRPSFVRFGAAAAGVVVLAGVLLYVGKPGEQQRTAVESSRPGTSTYSSASASQSGEIGDKAEARRPAAAAAEPEHREIATKDQPIPRVVAENKQSAQPSRDTISTANGTAKRADAFRGTPAGFVTTASLNSAPMAAPPPPPSPVSIAQVQDSDHIVADARPVDQPAPTPAMQQANSGEDQIIKLGAGNARSRKTFHLSRPALSFTRPNAVANSFAVAESDSGASFDNPRFAQPKKSKTAIEDGNYRIGRNGQLQRLSSVINVGNGFRAQESSTVWEDLPTAKGITLHALSVMGRHVWVGGTLGSLQHSSDGGENFQTVAGPWPPDADITEIHFEDLNRGQIKTSSGERWSTLNGGQTWNSD